MESTCKRHQIALAMWKGIPRLVFKIWLISLHWTEATPDSNEKVSEALNSRDCCSKNPVSTTPWHESPWNYRIDASRLRLSEGTFYVNCFERDPFMWQCVCPPEHNLRIQRMFGEVLHQDEHRYVAKEVKLAECIRPNASRKTKRTTTEVTALDLNVMPGKDTVWTKAHVPSRGSSRTHKKPRARGSQPGQEAGSIGENLSVTCDYTDQSQRPFSPGLWRSGNMKLILYKEDPILRQSIPVVVSYTNDGIYARTWRRGKEAVLKCVVSGQLLGYLSMTVCSWASVTNAAHRVYPRDQFTLNFGHHHAEISPLKQ